MPQTINKELKLLLQKLEKGVIGMRGVGWWGVSSIASGKNEGETSNSTPACTL